MFESINKALKLFFRGKSTVVERKIEALLNQISHDKSSKSSFLADLFDQICELENFYKLGGNILTINFCRKKQSNKSYSITAKVQGSN